MKFNKTAKVAIVVWIAFLSMLTWFWHSWQQQQKNPNQVVLVNSDQETVLKQNRSGHYLANGFINNQKVVFFVDTGATKIVIPQKTAEKINLKPGAKSIVHTANGLASAYHTKLAQVQLGNIIVKDLSGYIQPTMGGEVVLLGMNFLGKLNFSQSGDELKLKSINY